MVMDNRTLLQKADMLLSDLQTNGGYLQPAQAKEFLRLLIKEATVVKQCTVVPMKSHKQQQDKIRFSTSRILRKGAEAQALTEAQRAKPDISQFELDAELFKGEVRLTKETLEDNIERGTFKETVIQLMSERVALDADDIVFNSDTALADPDMSVLNGIRKQITSNLVDAGGNRTNNDYFRDALKAIPSEWKRRKDKMRFFVSENAELDYRHDLSDRIGEIGARFLEKDSALTYQGVPIVSVPVMPENLGAGDESEQILADPKNFHVGFWRRIQLEQDYEVTAGVFVIVVSLRMDVKIAVEEATAKIHGVQVP